MLTTDDICVLVFTSAKNLHERALSVQNTWLQNFNYGYLIGGKYIDPQLKMISAGDTVGEDYNSAADKQYFGLKALYFLHPDKKWYYIVGCDAYLFADNLGSLLSTIDSTEDYYVGGDCHDINLLGKTVKNLSGGAGFALSNSLVKKIIDKFDEIINYKYTMSEDEWSCCDVTLAYFIE